MVEQVPEQVLVLVFITCVAVDDPYYANYHYKEHSLKRSHKNVLSLVQWSLQLAINLQCKICNTQIPDAGVKYCLQWTGWTLHAVSFNNGPDDTCMFCCPIKYTIAHIHILWCESYIKRFSESRVQRPLSQLAREPLREHLLCEGHQAQRR